MAALAQLGERQTEDLKAPCSIHGGGISFSLHKLFVLHKWTIIICFPPNTFLWWDCHILTELIESKLATGFIFSQSGCCIFMHLPAYLVVNVNENTLEIMNWTCRFFIFSKKLKFFVHFSGTKTIKSAKNSAKKSKLKYLDRWSKSK